MAESKGSAHGSLYTRLGELQAMTPTDAVIAQYCDCLLYTSPSPRDATLSRMPSSA